MDERPSFLPGKIVTRISMAWKDVIINELSLDLRKLNFRQRALAMEYIHDRCRRYAIPEVTKILAKDSVKDALESNHRSAYGFVLLSQFVRSEKYIQRIVSQIRDLIPRWEQGDTLTVKDLYNERFPRRESIGEHHECEGEIVHSGSYFRCRSCKSIGQEIRETEGGDLILLRNDQIAESARRQKLEQADANQKDH